MSSMFAMGTSTAEQIASIPGYDFGVLLEGGVCHFHFHANPIQRPRFLARNDRLFDATRHIVEYRMTANDPIIRFALAFPMALAPPGTGRCQWSRSRFVLTVHSAIDLSLNDVIDTKWSATYDQRSHDEKHIDTTVIMAPHFTKKMLAVAIVTFEQTISKSVIPSIIAMCKEVFPEDRIAHYDMVAGGTEKIEVEHACVMIMFGHGNENSTSVTSSKCDERYKSFNAKVIADSIAAIRPLVVLTGVCHGAVSLIPELHRLLPDVAFLGYQKKLYGETAACGSFVAYLSILLQMMNPSVGMHQTVNYLVKSHQQRSDNALAMLEALMLIALDSARVNPCYSLQSDLSDITLYNAKLLSYTLNFEEVQKLYSRYNKSLNLPIAEWKPIPLDVYRREYWTLVHKHTGRKQLQSHLLQQRRDALEYGANYPVKINSKGQQLYQHLLAARAKIQAQQPQPQTQPQPTCPPTTTPSNSDHDMTDRDDDMDTSFSSRKPSAA